MLKNPLKLPKEDFEHYKNAHLQMKRQLELNIINENKE